MLITACQVGRESFGKWASAEKYTTTSLSRPSPSAYDNIQETLQNVLIRQSKEKFKVSVYVHSTDAIVWQRDSECKKNCIRFV